MSNEPLCLPSPEDPSQFESHATNGGTSDSSGSGFKSGAGRAPGGERRSTSRSSGGKEHRSYPTEEECLAAIARLAALVAMGVLTVSRANSIRASFAEILRWHKTAKGSREEQRFK